MTVKYVNGVSEEISADDEAVFRSTQDTVADVTAKREAFLKEQRLEVKRAAAIEALLDEQGARADAPDEVKDYRIERRTP